MRPSQTFLPGFETRRLEPKARVKPPRSQTFLPGFETSAGELMSAGMTACPKRSFRDLKRDVEDHRPEQVAGPKRSFRDLKPGHDRGLHRLHAESQTFLPGFETSRRWRRCGPPAEGPKRSFRDLKPGHDRGLHRLHAESQTFLPGFETVLHLEDGVVGVVESQTFLPGFETSLSFQRGPGLAWWSQTFLPGFETQFFIGAGHELFLSQTFLPGFETHHRGVGAVGPRRVPNVPSGI